MVKNPLAMQEPNQILKNVSTEYLKMIIILSMNLKVLKIKVYRYKCSGIYNGKMGAHENNLSKYGRKYKKNI